jgi:hypothetical protein
MTRHRKRASALLRGQAMRTALRACALALAALLIGGCGQSEADWRSASSWSLTAVAVARAWQRGEVPARYARRTLKKAAEELARGPLPVAAAPVDELREAIERGDRDAVRELVRELSAR